MSNFDPSLPSGVSNATPVQPINYNEVSYDFQRGNTARNVRGDATASASVIIGETNYNARGATFFFNVSSLPGSASTTLAMKVRVADPASGKFYTILGTPSISASGMQVMTICPGISASALGLASPLPRNLNILISQSSGATNKKVTWSLGISFSV